MKKFYDTVVTQSGDVIQGASIQVNIHGGGAASLFSDSAGTIPKTNPLTTDANGYYDFYSADGKYDLIISASGFTGYSVVDVLNSEGALPVNDALLVHLAGDEIITGNKSFQGRVNVANIVGGTANAIAATFSPIFTALVDKMQVIVRAGAANTGAVTLAPDGLTAEPVYKNNGVALVAGDIAGAQHELHLVRNAGLGWLLLNPYVGIHEVRGHGHNGYGAVATKIKRLNTIIKNVGTSITYANDADQGATFTINAAGKYSIHYQDSNGGGASTLGISLNSNQLTTNIQSITAADIMALATSSGAAVTASCSVTLNLVATDVIRMHTDGTANDAQGRFTICRIG